MPVPADGLGRAPEGLVGNRGVTPHHALGLPTSEGHHDWGGEARIEGHRRPVMPEVVKAEIAEPGAPAGLPEDAAHMHPGIGASLRVREDPLRVVAGQLRAEGGASLVPFMYSIGFGGGSVQFIAGTP